MFRFTVRDLLWLTLVVALGLGWFVHTRQLRGEVARIQAEANQMRAVAAPAIERAKKWRKAAGAAEAALEKLGAKKVSWDFNGQNLGVLTKDEQLLMLSIDSFEPSAKDDHEE